MKNKVGKIVDTIWGATIKNRWKKILATIILLLVTTAICLFIIFNVGYDSKAGWFIKPTELKINIGDKK